jgi:hypothetical protein
LRDASTRESLEPVCPFCPAKLERPSEITISAAEKVLGGTCGTCGALSIYDPTGKNLGEAMLQTLDLASRELSKDVSEMVAGEDYDDVILSYDIRTHRSSGKTRGAMSRYGCLYVLKVKRKGC